MAGTNKDKDFSSGTEKQVEGWQKEVEGNTRKAVNDAMDDTSKQIKANVKDAEGKVQKSFGKA